MAVPPILPAAPAPRPADHRFPCANCGASLQFRPGQQALVCEYCGHVQTIIAPPHPIDGALQWDAGHKAPDLPEIPLQDGLRLDRDPGLTQSVRSLACPNCGARIEAGADTHATTCPFCATPVVSDPDTIRQIRPQGVLPFALTEDQARHAMEGWLGGLWFAPSGLLAYARRGRRMRGIYAPFWTFDAHTRSDYAGQRGTAYLDTVMVTQTIDGRSRQVPRQVRRIRWQPVAGRVARDFNDVLVTASTALPPAFATGLTPWNLSDLRAYRPDYLAGFEAEGYTLPLADGHVRARAEMAKVIAQDVRRDIGGDAQQIDRIRTDHRSETFKHVLLPVWTAAYRYNAKSYRFVVNAQTGRVMGERPWSVWKIATAVIAALIALAVVLYLGEAGGYVQLGCTAPTTPGDAGALVPCAPADDQGRGLT